MSEKIATGISQAVTEKSAGWVEFEIDVGSQYPVRLATKQSETIELGRAAHRGGERMDWHYVEKESDKINEKSGKPFVNRYLNSVSLPDPSNATSSVATPEAAPKDAMTKEEWARKDSAIHKMACIKTAADALKHTVPSDPTPEDLATFLARVSTLTLAWHRSVLAERDDPTGEDVPF